MDKAPNLSYLNDEVKALRQASSVAFDGGGGGGYDNLMEARLTKLEDFAADAKERLSKIETRLDQTATKADLHEQTSTMVKWIVGTVSGLGVAGITVMTFVLNNAVPKTQLPQPPQPLPIVIYPQPMTPIQPQQPSIGSPAAK